MKRRDFLKLSLGGLTATALPVGLLQIALGSSRIEANAFGELFRGMPDGRLLASSDKGETWGLAANFGESCPVLDLFKKDGELYVKLGIQEFEFYLKSRDGFVWRSLDA